MVVDQQQPKGWWRNRLFFLLELLFVAAVTAVVSLFALGLWDFDQAREQAIHAWRATRTRGERITAAEPPTGDSGSEPADCPAVQWRVRMRSGELCQAQPLLDHLTLETEFGALRIPIQDVLAVAPDASKSVVQRRRIAVLIDRLGAPEAETVRETVEQIIQIGPDALEQLDQAVAHRELEISRMAAEIATRIRGQGNVAAQPAGGDLVIARYFGIRGQLSEDTISLHTEQGDQTLAWADVRRIDRGSWTTAMTAMAVRKSVSVDAFNIQTDRETWTGTPQNESLRIETPYGLLQVPLSKVAEFRRADREARRAAELATVELLRSEDTAARLSALDRLAALHSAGGLMLQRVAECDDPQLRATAERLLAKLAEQGDPFTPLPFRIATSEGLIAGDIQNPTLDIRTEWGDIQRIDLARILSMTPAKGTRQ